MRDAGLARRCTLFLLAAASLVAVDLSTSWLVSAKTVLGSAVMPIHVLADAPGRGLTSLVHVFESRTDVIRHRDQLLAERQAMQLRLQRLATLEIENARLRQLLGSNVAPNLALRVSEVVGLVPNPDKRQYVIDKGRADGVHVSQPVLNAEGVVGQVVGVTQLGARVLLLTDPEHAVLAEVSRTGFRVVVAGTGHPRRLEVRHVAATADVKVGDELISTGLGDVFPRGYPVATIVAVGAEPGSAFLEVTAQPKAHLEAVTHVLLVYPDDGTGQPLTPWIVPTQGTGPNAGLAPEPAATSTDTAPAPATPAGG